MHRLLYCCAACCLLGASLASTPSTGLLSADIPPQPLAQALTAFGEQTGLQLFYLSGIAAERSSKGARAGLGPSEALTQLLQDTGLTFQFLNSKSVRIFDPAAAAGPNPATVPAKRTARATAAAPEALENIVIVGLRDEAGQNIHDFVQSVPASVSAVSAESLEAQKSESLLDYAADIPGLDIDDFGYPGRRLVIIRGVETFSNASSVAYYLDDVPVGASGSYADACCSVLELMPYDLDQIEVLRGPQGTLYGAESEVGLIRYVLKAPSLEGFEGRIGADLDTVQGAGAAGNASRATVNVPIVDEVLAVRLSGYANQTPGYINNAYTGIRDGNARLHEGGASAHCGAQSNRSR